MDRKKILVVVDDDTEYRQALLSLFEGHPIEVLGFQTGEDAVEFLQGLSVHPDLIVLDIELKIGGLSGVEVAHQLRRECGIGSPILFLSSEPTVEVWTHSIPGTQALSKQNSFRKIYAEIMSQTGPVFIPDAAHIHFTSSTMT